MARYVSKNALAGTVFGVGLLMAVVMFCYFWNFNGELSVATDVWGQFGDYLGGVLNPILSFFAFMALMYTVHLQISSGEEAEERHNEQLFDSRLFQLLDVNFKVAEKAFVSRIQASGPDTRVVTWHGIEALDYAWVILRGNLKDVKAKGLEGAQAYKAVFHAVDLVKKSEGRGIYSYFDSCFVILEYLRSRAVSGEQNSFGATALRAQMAGCSRALLFYYLISSKEHCQYMHMLEAMRFWDEVTDDPFGKERAELFVAASERHLETATFP